MAIKAKSLIIIIIPVNFLFVIFIFTPIFAEVIVFNSGQTLNTKIKERTPKYIRVEADNYGTVLKYPIEQI